MKKILSLVIPVLLITMTIGCTKSTVDSPGEVTPVVTLGEWKVSLFSERGVSETSDFAGYSFVFQTDGKLIVKKLGATQKEGSWSEDKSSHKLIIDLGVKDNTNKPLGQLTDDWIVSSRNDSKISLKDDNSGSNEILEFNKN